MMRPIVFPLILLLSHSAVAQSPTSAVQEAVEELEGVIKTKNENLAFWRTATATAIEIACQKAIKAIRPVAATSVANGDQEMASEAYFEILKIDASDQEARDYFRKNKQLEAIQKQLKQRSLKNAEPLLMIQYEMDNGVTYKKQADGSWVTLNAEGEVDLKLKELERNSYSVLLQERSNVRQRHLLLPDQLLWAWESGWKKGNRAMKGSGYWSR